MIDEEKLNLILELYWTSNLGIRKIADFAGVSTMTAWRAINLYEPRGETI
ncbi:MAG: hypothetical protein QXT45_05345 [Candidatus Bilamarchaeaceae archaeon]